MGSLSSETPLWLCSPLFWGWTAASLLVPPKTRVPWGFSGDSGCKESVCNAGDLGSIPGSGRSPGEGNDNPTTQFYPHFWHLEIGLEVKFPLSQMSFRDTFGVFLVIPESMPSGRPPGLPGRPVSGCLVLVDATGLLVIDVSPLCQSAGPQVELMPLLLPLA